jgi:hypothetical protein
MEIATEYSQVKDYEDQKSGLSWKAGNIYQILVCPACYNVTFRKYFWHDLAIDPSEIQFEILYPLSKEKPLGLPGNIEKSLEAATKVRNVDANAYAVLIRRVLELLCIDRKASGKYLNDKLADLSKKGEMPDKLVGVAKNLRIFGNIGAHPTLGELSDAEVPILDNLCKAILEYVYTAPFLAEQAEKKVKQLKNQKLNTP